MGMYAGPLPFLCFSTQVGPYRIEFHIANSCQQMFLVKHRRMKTLLPKMSTPFKALIYGSRITPVSFAEKIYKASFVVRHHHEMDVIRHQTVSPDIDVSPVTSLMDKPEIKPEILV